MGDFEEEEHTPAVISEFRFMPEQTEEMELEIYNKYKSLRSVVSVFCNAMSIIYSLINALFYTTNFTLMFASGTSKFFGFGSVLNTSSLSHLGH